MEKQVAKSPRQPRLKDYYATPETVKLARKRAKEASTRTGRIITTRAMLEVMMMAAS